MTEGVLHSRCGINNTWCYSNIGCHETDVRLLEGATKMEGRLEICKNNVWRTVCQSLWDRLDSRVVCQQLGYSVIGKLSNTWMKLNVKAYLLDHILGTAFRINAFYGQGTGPAALNSVQCRGTERRLIDCIATAHQCPHTQDVGVQCLRQTGNLYCLAFLSFESLLCYWL